jgi:hypothetical protein
MSESASPFVVGVWGFPFVDAPALYPFIALKLDALLERRRPQVLLCTAADSGVLRQARRYAQVEEVGLVPAEGAAGVLAQADALMVFHDGQDAEGPRLFYQAQARGKPARLIRVPGGEVAHLPLWDDLVTG